MRVELINKNEVKDIFKHWGEFSKVCYDTKTNAPEKIGKHCMNSGHFSGSRSRYFEFLIEDCPRFCYDETTEILTNQGWKYFKDISDNETVATRNWDNGQVEFKPINSKISYNYTGEMYNIKSSNVDLKITSNHKLFFQKYDVRKDKKNFYLEHANRITYNRIKMNKEFNYELKHLISSTVTIKGFNYNKLCANQKHTSMNSGDLTFNRKTFYKFLAWYLSDGNVVFNSKEHRYQINITQTKCEENIKNQTREQIIKIIKDMGLNPTETEHGIVISNLTLGKYLKELGISHEKEIPFNIFKNFNKELALDFLNEYYKGDGWRNQYGGGKFYTSSKVLADQLQTLCFIGGWTAMIYKRNEKLVGKQIKICGKTVKCNYIGYVINVSPNNTNRKPLINFKKHKTITNVNCESVYCVDVENHVIFVRRNGKAIWCGNCVDQCVRHEQGCCKNVQSFRYVNKDNFTYEVPVEISDNKELLYDYNEHMKRTIELYSNIQEYVHTKTDSKERANEQARYVLPMSTHSAFVMGFTIEALIHLMNERLCIRTEDVFRELAMDIRDCVLEILPELEDRLVPQCEDKLYCPEKYGCGLYPSKQEVKDVLNKHMK